MCKAKKKKERSVLFFLRSFPCQEAWNLALLHDAEAGRVRGTLVSADCIRASSRKKGACRKSFPALELRHSVPGWKGVMQAASAIRDHACGRGISYRV